MCGLTGFFIFNKSMDRNKLIKNLNEMTAALIHRGPDAQNIWINNQNTLGLGHTRLSIRDLSSLGNQPMLSSCGRYVIVYNGEIYSHSELKEELIKKGVKFKSTTDTEIILESISKFGFKETLIKLNGMFAIAMYDKKKDKLYLTRDRIGIKPLYWGKFENNFFFGSELKSIKKFFGFKNILSKIAINYFIKWGFITAPLSIYENVYKVVPGEIIEVDNKINIKKKTYWQLNDIIKNRYLSENNLNYQHSLLSLENLINDSVKKSLVSDVPIGSFLSGGIDSTIVSYFMQKNSKEKIKTFSLGFEETEIDESQDAKKVAKFIGSDHNELYFSSKDIIKHFDKIPEIYDEPFADSSQMPTSLISEYAKKSVSVILSGDGGDELFGGYNRYVETLKRSSTQSNLINKLKNQIIYFIGKFPGSLQNKIGNLFSISNIENKVKNYNKNYFKKEPEKIYVQLLAQFAELKNIINYQYINDISDFEKFNNLIKDVQEKFMYFDTMNYLPEDILTKVDRASMHYSLEVRVPLLDYRIVEFAWSLPIKYKIKDNKQKIILRDILKKNVPLNLIKNNKMGFGIPVDNWIRTKLIERVNHYLNPDKLKKSNFLNTELIKEMLENHINLKENNGSKLWNIIILHQWLEYNQN
jgi:asparagine synthase (glutamine-hydrolysing)